MAKRKKTPSPEPVPGLSEEEVARRVEVLKRFKELLKAQRDRFRSYLDALDRQKGVIESGSAEELVAHVELEEKLVSDIVSMQKVIGPMEEMYRRAYETPPDAAEGEEGVWGLQSALEGLKSQALLRAERNRELLSQRMVLLRNEIKSLRANPYAKRRPSGGAPSLIDIRG